MAKVLSSTYSNSKMSTELPVLGAAARMVAKKGGKEGAKKVSKRGNRNAEGDIIDANLIGLSAVKAGAAKAGLATAMALGQEDRIKAAGAKREQEAREAAAEMKRETRGVKK